MIAYTTFQTRETPQSEAIPGKDMVQNSAGGFVFALNKWQRLERFLILGSEGGTFYVGEQKLTKDNAVNVLACIQENALRVLDIVVDVSTSGRAPKNDPALFALALVLAHGGPRAVSLVREVLPKVARTGTHLFHFVQYATQFRGWGRGLRGTVANWYLQKTPITLAKQVTKYAQRDGWSHRDLLRLAHVTPPDEEYDAIFKYVLKGTVNTEINDESLRSDAVNYLAVVECIKAGVMSLKDVLDMIDEFELPREVLPTELLTKAEVWEALLPHMGLTAMIRNLGNMSKVGLLTPMSNAESLIVSKLGDEAALKRERVHPLAILLGQSVYGQGHGLRGSGVWKTSGRVLDALEDAFVKAFQTVDPTGARTLLALDVSGSMSIGGIAGTPLTPREATAAMAMVTARTEPIHAIMAFATKFVPLNITARTSLKSAVQEVSRLGFGDTDCALPMTWALKEKVPVDAFVVYTDNETWAGDIHPVQALQKYRQKMGIPAKLVVVGMTSTGFSIADPSDAGMLDVVGFDAAAPTVISNFIR